MVMVHLAVMGIYINSTPDGCLVMKHVLMMSLYGIGRNDEYTSYYYIFWICLVLVH